MATTTRMLRCAAAVAVTLLSVVFIDSGVADAGLGVGATPTFPAVVTVGDTGVPATIQLVNDNTTPNTSATLCNFGDPLPCPVGDPGITLIPSCGQLGPFSVCAPAGAEPGVFLVSATGLGRAGSACAGTTFAITLIDPVFGQLRFTPEPAASHVVLPTVGSNCTVDFTFDVLRVPTVDQNPIDAGVQTVQVVDFTEQDGGSVTASARGTSIGTRVDRAPTAINTIASASLVVGGTMADQATVSGRVNPQPGATVDFRLYGPNDATCSGPSVFDSLGVPYPVAGGPVTSASFTPPTAGTYRWVATYSGDVNNQAASGVCNGGNESVEVSPLPPAPVAQSHAPAASQPGSPVLPATGSDDGAMLRVAFGLSIAGFLLVAATLTPRRRRAEVAATVG